MYKMWSANLFLALFGVEIPTYVSNVIIFTSFLRGLVFSLIRAKMAISVNG